MNITRKIVAFACLVSLTGVVGPQLAYGDVLREAEKMVSEAVSLYSRSGPGDVVRAKALFKKAADAGHPLGVMWVARSHFRGRVGFREDRDLAETLAGRVLATVQELARGGNAEALFLLASALDDGLAVPRDSRQAAGMYLKAANAGHRFAQNNLGWMYQNGHGVKQSDVKAVEWYRKAAEQGDSTAQNNLGTMYRDGHGVKQNDEKAVEWYRKAAERGYAAAENNLGWMYENGRGVEQSDERAAEWYRKGAEQGYANAQYRLGKMHYHGKGVAEDDDKAMRWFRVAAEAGHRNALYYLGEMYDKGHGVPTDHAEAVRWFRLAAEKGHAESQRIMGDVYRRGLGGVTKDAAESARWYRLAAEQGNSKAQRLLGWMYRKGLGMKQSDVKAVEWYRKAAEQGYADAQIGLGWMYEKGRGVEQSDERAVEWYRKAAEQGHATAQKNLGGMYAKGRGVKQSDAKAVEWYRKAAEQGHADAQNSLGLRYSKGRGVKQSDMKAVEWYRKAAEQGDAWGENNLGGMYATGRGLKQSDVKAVEWYRKAAEQENATAQTNLGEMYAEGRGTARNDAVATRWYLKAAALGHAEVVNRIRKSAEAGQVAAQYALARLYEMGEGVEQSDNEAAKWYAKAAGVASVRRTEVKQKPRVTRGRTRDLRIELSYDPGGYTDFYARSMARHIGRHFPEPVVPLLVHNPRGWRNRSDSDFATFRNGPTRPSSLALTRPRSRIGALLRMSSFAAPLMRDVEIVGGLWHGQTTCFIDPSRSQVTIDSIIARTKKPLTVASSADPLNPLVFVNDHAGRDIFHLVLMGSGYQRRLLREGVVDVICQDWDVLRAVDAELVEKFVPFLTNRRRSGEKMENIPLFSDILSGPSLEAFQIWDKLQDLRVVVVTKARGSRLHEMRNALKATARDPLFVGNLRSRGFPIDYIPPEIIQEGVDAIESMSATSRNYWIQGEKG